MLRHFPIYFFFFFNDPAPPEIYPLPLHAALPIYIRHAEPKSVAIGKPGGGIVAQPRGEHGVMGGAGPDAEEVLPHAGHRSAGESLQPGALLAEQIGAIRRGEAAVQADLAAALHQTPDDRRGGRRLRPIRQVSGPHGRERRRSAQDEPRGEDAVLPLRFQQGPDPLPHRIPAGSRERRAERSTPAAELSLSRELGQAQQREQRPVRDDVQVVGERRGPALAVGPRRREDHPSPAGARDHGGAQPRGGTRPPPLRIEPAPPPPAPRPPPPALQGGGRGAGVPARARPPP